MKCQTASSQFCSLGDRYLKLQSEKLQAYVHSKCSNHVSLNLTPCHLHWEEAV